MDDKKKKKIKTSPIRIAIGVLVFLLLFYAASFADTYLSTIPHYKDYTPIWSKDGKSILFTRWHLPLPDKAEYFEILKTDVNGSKTENLFQSPAGYSVFNIRRISLSADGAYLNLRLNKQRGDIMNDYLYKIPLDKNKKTESWELEKKFIFDVFLAYRNDKVIVRKMTENGKNAASVIQICNFSDRKILTEIPYKDRNTVCVYADFYGNDDKPLLLNRISRNGNIEDSYNELIVPAENRCFDLKIFPYDIVYLKKENAFTGIDMSSGHLLHLMDIKTGTIKPIDNPGGNDSQVSIAGSSDSSDIIVGSSNIIYRINPVTGKTDKIPVPSSIDGSIPESPDGKTYIFSSGTTINSINRDGTGYREITEPSPLTRMMKNNTYKAYMAKRGELIHMAEENH